MYAQYVRQFNEISLHMSNLLEEHKVTVIQYRASKDEALGGRIDVSDMRCAKLESLICETMDEHEETKGKLWKQLALGKKQSWDIHDLNDEIAGKYKTLVNMEIDSRKEKRKEWSWSFKFEGAKGYNSLPNPCTFRVIVILDK